MKVLVACEFSGVVRDAFYRRGHDVWSCDLLPGEGEYWTNHLYGNVLHHLGDGWDLMIAHPPCTYLCNSGVRWLYRNKKIYEPRWALMHQAAAFFKQFLDAPIDKICIENPVMHGHAKRIIGADFAQSIQPWQFGHGEVKRTCLWLKNLPKLEPTNIVEGREARIHRMPPGPDRSKERSRTYQGIADAMAIQWGDL